MRVYIHTHGCRLNAAESRFFAEALESRGHEIARAMDGAVDCAIVNSCAVTAQAESKCKQTLRQIVRAHPDVLLVVTGCLAEKNPHPLLDFHRRILVLGNAEKHRVADYLERHDMSKNSSEIVHKSIGNASFSLPCLLDRPCSGRYNLKIQEGCDFGCAYCIIPRLRGRARSRDFRNLVEDAAVHVARGVKEIILTGINVGIYRDGSKNLADVIAELGAIPGLARIRLSSIEFGTIGDEILSQMADPESKLVKYLHMPIQSGSDRILLLMGRRYGIAAVWRYLEGVAKKIPGIGLGTDLMVGFPGESERDFECSMELLEGSPLQYAHIFSYSPRDGTAARAMEAQWVDRREIGRRSEVLRAVSREKHRQFLEQQVGKCEKVLFEDPGKSGFGGFTEHYVKVLVKNSAEDLRNQIRKVRLVENCGTFLLGEL
ncbi:MAG: MiaB/RimO family radical SAM methylthiotransferase [Puniceicoccales bacterium]|jgi:threonylcarbamoyladenosine tRNA methylthiotransferase MtaB|nr:MiaB/RimO family radical SAM methylthiotransferase [Puniceicoccales bacterium]